MDDIRVYNGNSNCAVDDLGVPGTPCFIHILDALHSPCQERVETIAAALQGQLDDEEDAEEALNFQSRESALR